MKVKLPIDVKILETNELISKLKHIKNQGGQLYGFDPTKSQVFDDFIADSSESLSKLIESASPEELDQIKRFQESLIKERNDTLIQKLFVRAGTLRDEKLQNSLDIENGYSFEDVKATISKPSILEQARFDYDNPDYKEVPAVIKIGGVPFGSLGNFSMIIGKPKSKKTFLSTLFASSALSDGDSTGLISISLPKDKSKVIYFDTEQSTVHLGKIVDRVKFLVKDFKRNHFETFTLRPVSIEERLAALEQLFIEYQEIGLVIIDGIKDLVHEVNNEAQATEIAGKLLELTHLYNVHIIVVLHQNKGDDNARGHLGAELQNKAETTVSISSRKHLSVIKPVSTRNEEFHPFGLELKQVTFNNQDIVVPYVIENLETDNNGRVKKPAIEPDKIQVEVHRQILSDLSVSCTNEDINKGRAAKLIIEYAKVHKLEFGDSKSKKFLKYYEDNCWVEMIKPDGNGRAKMQVNNNKIQ